MSGHLVYSHTIRSNGYSSQTCDHCARPIPLHDKINIYRYPGDPFHASRALCARCSPALSAVEEVES